MASETNTLKPCQFCGAPTTSAVVGCPGCQRQNALAWLAARPHMASNKRAA